MLTGVENSANKNNFLNDSERVFQNFSEDQKIFQNITFRSKFLYLIRDFLQLIPSEETFATQPSKIPISKVLKNQKCVNKTPDFIVSILSF